MDVLRYGSMTYAVGISLPAAGVALGTAQGVRPAGADRSGRRGSPGGSPSQTAIQRLRGGRGSSRAAVVSRIEPVKPSPTQSNLVKPSPTINFRRKRRNWLKNPKRGHFLQPSHPVRRRPGEGGSPPATTPPTQPTFAGPTAGTYGLIRPNTALIIFEKKGCAGPIEADCGDGPREKPIDRVARHRVCWAVNLGG